MYTIRYDDKVEKIMEEKEGEYCWKIGIGDKKDRSYILYDVFSD